MDLDLIERATVYTFGGGVTHDDPRTRDKTYPYAEGRSVERIRRR